MTAIEQHRRQLTRETAEKFRNQGYEVTIDAPLDFMDGFSADLLARRGDEIRVIQVKTRAALGADPRNAELAGILEDKLGWSFNLVMVPEPERIPAPSGARPFSFEEVSGRLEEAEKLVQSGHHDAGLLMAWSALEAVLRLQKAKVEAPRDSRPTTANYVLEGATHLGVIYHEEYFRLFEIAGYRNAIVHGFTHDGDAKALAEELIRMAEVLILRDPCDEDELEPTIYSAAK